MPGAADEVPSELVADKYRLTRLLGRGGMGSVWEGLHTSLGTRVAVKFIDAAYAEDEEARNRFRTRRVQRPRCEASTSCRSTTTG